MKPSTTAIPNAAALLCVILALCACGSRGKTIRISPELRGNQQERLVESIDLAAKASSEEDHERAMDLYWQAITVYPELAPAWNNLGELLMEHDRALEAADAFQQAMLLAPNDPRPVYNMGLLWDRKGFRQRARQYYLDALERDPYFLNALRGAIRADALLNQGTDDTLSNIERALLLERNEQWEKWLRGQKVRVENLLAGSAAVR